MTTTATIPVPHLSTTAGYSFGGRPYDAAKPTCVLVNAMCTTASLYGPQFGDAQLADAMNLLAIEPLGHGATVCGAGTEHFTYWDSATVLLQVLDALGVDKVFAAGTSQGGWIVARMALLAPARILGLLLLGTSMDSESAASRSKGCWDPVPAFRPFLAKWSNTRDPTPDFAPDDEWVGACTDLGFGFNATSAETSAFWRASIREVYGGDAGRRKLRAAVIALAERDGLLLRLPDITCPVHWLHGTADFVYSPDIANEQIKLFTGSSDVRLCLIRDGAHYLSATNPRDVNQVLLALVTRNEFNLMRGLLEPTSPIRMVA